MKKRSASKPGKDAWKYSIGPSHKRYLTQLRKKNTSKLVREPKGLPDFIVHDKNTEFYELKPNKTGTKGKMRSSGTNRKYLNPRQEKVIRRMLRSGVKNTFIVYYNKYLSKNKGKEGRFVFKEEKLTLKNLKSFCVSSRGMRFDPDCLFPKESEYYNKAKRKRAAQKAARTKRKNARKKSKTRN